MITTKPTPLGIFSKNFYSMTEECELIPDSYKKIFFEEVNMCDKYEIAIADLKEENLSLCDEIDQLKKQIQNEVPVDDKHALKYILQIRKFINDGIKHLDNHDAYVHKLDTRVTITLEDYFNIEEALGMAVNIITKRIKDERSKA